METMLVPQSLHNIQALRLFVAWFQESKAMQSTREKLLSGSFYAAYNGSQQVLQKGMNTAVRSLDSIFPSQSSFSVPELQGERQNAGENEGVSAEIWCMEMDVSEG